MSSLYLKLIPLAVSLILFVAAFRVHERFWALGFSGWKKLYLGLAAIILGAAGGVIFEFSEPRRWQATLGWPIDWLLLGVLASVGAALVFSSSVERLRLAAREQEDLRVRREGFELFDSLRDAAQGPYSFLEVLSFSLKEIVRSVNGDAGGIWLAHPSRGSFILACASGFPVIVQQKLEVLSAAHPGFSRLAGGESPRAVTDVETIRRWFPELFTSARGYAELLGVPLVARQTSPSHREPLGIVLICSRERGAASPANLKLIHSAVTFLAATVAEARAYRLVRGHQQSDRQRQVAEQNFGAWCLGWMREPHARRRLQLALSGLATDVGDFIGCARYIPRDDRWEPLAMAGTENEHLLLGREDVRRAAITALTVGKETFVQSSPEEAGYRMLPIPDPQDAERNGAALFLPTAGNLPCWWDRAIILLVELARVVLAEDVARTSPAREKMVSPAPSGPDWRALAHLIHDGASWPGDKLADGLAAALPPGLRAAIWKADPDDRRTFRLVLATAPGIPSVYYPPERRHTAPVADRTEVDAHFGGLVRVECGGPGALSSVWPDFGAGWRGERIGFSSGASDSGWVTFYHRNDQADRVVLDLEYLQSVAGATELLLARIDRSAGSTFPEQSARAGPPLVPAGSSISQVPPLPGTRSYPVPEKPVTCLPLDRAVVRWIAVQPGHVRLGGLELSPGPEGTPTVPVSRMDSLLAWAVAMLTGNFPAPGQVSVAIRSDGRQVRLTVERSAHTAGIPEDVSGPAAPVLPRDPEIRGMLAAHDGDCRVEYSPDGARRVTVSFAPEVGTPATALVIEDQEPIRDLLLGMLEMLGVRPMAAATVTDARRLFGVHEFAWVVCGSSVPGADDSFFRALKGDRPACRLLVVAEPGQISLRDANRDLLDGFLMKPFRVDELRTLLEIPLHLTA